MAPCTTSRRYAGSVALAVTPAARALLLTGRSCGPSPERTLKTETFRSHGTVPPTVSSTAAAEAMPAERTRPRRDRPSPGGSSWSTGPARASRTTGSLTAMCTTSAPITTQATAKWVDLNENDQGYQVVTLASPVASWKIAAATRTPTEVRSATCSSSSRDGRGGRIQNLG